MSACPPRGLFFALALLTMAGCAVFGSGTDRALQRDPAFREGYDDGCTAATSHGSDLRDRTVGDQKRMTSDEMYRKGWNSGFQSCRRNDIEPDAAPGDSPLRLPGPGH